MLLYTKRQPSLVENRIGSVFGISDFRTHWVARHVPRLSKSGYGTIPRKRNLYRYDRITCECLHTENYWTIFPGWVLTVRILNFWHSPRKGRKTRWTDQLSNLLRYYPHSPKLEIEIGKIQGRRTQFQLLEILQLTRFPNPCCCISLPGLYFIYLHFNLNRFALLRIMY